MKKCIKKIIQIMIQQGKCLVNQSSGIEVVRTEMFHNNPGGIERCQQSLRLMHVSTGQKVSAW